MDVVLGSEFFLVKNSKNAPHLRKFLPEFDQTLIFTLPVNFYGRQIISGTMSKFICIPLLLLAIISMAKSISETETDPVDQHLSSNETLLSKEVYKKCYSIMKKSRVFRNYTYEAIVEYLNEAEAFKPPEFLAHRFPYYLAGYDYEDRPVWVGELGKYKMDDLIDRILELFPIFEKMGIQAAINVVKSFVAKEKERPGKDIRQYVEMIDFEGFDVKLAYKVLAHPELIVFGIKLTELYLDLGEATLAKVILLNTNHAAQIFIQLARPVIGELMERIVVLGSNKYKWKAELRRHLPEETTPTWYGGPKDFKPLVVYGA